MRGVIVRNRGRARASGCTLDAVGWGSEVDVLREPRSRPRAVLALALAGVACGSPAAGDESSGSSSAGESGSEGTTAALPDCAVDPDFTPCNEDGICLAGTCVQRLPCAGPACGAGPTFALADTNVRACFGRSPDGMDGTIPCPGQPGSEACAGTDHCGQDAQYGWDVDHDASARFTVQAGDEPLAVDEVTGLQWQLCSAGQAGAGCAGEATLMSWYDAEAYCNDASWGGHDDWVLPTSFALQSITDYGTTSPAIDVGVFVNAPSKFAEDYDQWWIECTWSSSSYAGDPEVAWALMVNSGDVAEGSGLEYHLHDKAADGWPGCYARCVRAPAPAQWQRFLRLEPVAGEPVVADTVTERMWQGCSLGQSGGECSGEASMVDWLGALAACEGSTWGGYDDWTLPNVKELRSIVDQSVQSPAIDATAFPGTPFYGVGMTTPNIGQYWSSTARSYNDFALYVDFGQGFSHFYEQPEARHVRCVRDP
jgi:hypothetical protein